MFSTWTRATFYSVLLPGPQHYYAAEEKVPFKYSSAALVLSIGREFFRGEHITFDISGGLGYGAQWREETAIDFVTYDEDRQEYAFSHLFITGTSPMVLYQFASQYNPVYLLFFIDASPK